MIADMKELDIPLQILANDDEQSHIDLVGKKIVPILLTKEGHHMTESMAICHYLDQIDDNPVIHHASKSGDFKNWVDQLTYHAKFLTHPRQIFHPMNFADFPTQSAKNYFRAKKEQSLGVSFEKAISNSDTYATNLMPVLETLDDHLSETLYATSNHFSEDDLVLFPLLRSLTIAQDAIHLPYYINQYLNRINEQTNIALYFFYEFQS
jgi:glutaredoxin 2